MLTLQLAGLIMRGVSCELRGTFDTDRWRSNLYASLFPSIGAENPSLTAAANALRVGDHLLDRSAD